MICHGSSEARTITAAIRAAFKYSQHEVNQGIIEALAHTEQPASEEVA